MSDNRDAQDTIAKAKAMFKTTTNAGHWWVGWHSCPYCAPRCPCCGRLLGGYGLPTYPYITWTATPGTSSAVSGSAAAASPDTCSCPK